MTNPLKLNPNTTPAFCNPYATYANIGNDDRTDANISSHINDAHIYDKPSNAADVPKGTIA